MKSLLIATQNPGKIAEIQAICAEIGYTLIVPDKDFDVEETGTTFEENARLKARAFSAHFGNVLALADDSGLEVDALDGRPGVYSKRYAQTDALRMQKLLTELENVPAEKRTARFVSVIALYGDGIDEFFRGTVEGKIGYEVKGSQGFGYDPLFIPDGHDQTFGELGSVVKNTMSHRANALSLMKAFLLQREESTNQ